MAAPVGAALTVSDHFVWVAMFATAPLCSESVRHPTRTSRRSAGLAADRAGTRALLSLIACALEIVGVAGGLTTYGAVAVGTLRASTAVGI